MSRDQLRRPAAPVHRPSLPPMQSPRSSIHTRSTPPTPAPSKQEYVLMPPPPIPALSSSMSSSGSSSGPGSTYGSSRLSLSPSERSIDGIVNTGPVDTKIKSPLQEVSSNGPIGLSDDVDAKFDHLLDTLQVPASVRVKFGTVTRDVKLSILKSSTSSNPAILAPLGLSASTTPTPPTSDKAKKKMATPRLRKTKSSDGLRQDNSKAAKAGQNSQVGRTTLVGNNEFVIVASPGAQRTPTHHPRNSVDVGRAGVNSPRTSGFYPPPSPTPKLNPAEVPDAYVHWLKSNKSTDLGMDVTRAKKLRMLLRHESTAWVDRFVHLGGYTVLLDRLQDLLDVEWREEQHDDKMLYELLRCFKALSTSEVGKAALRSGHPRPFDGLSALLFSEKKPGDLACRQIIIELLVFHFELYTSSNAPTPSATSSGEQSSRSSIRFDSPPLPAQPPVYKDATLFIYGLLTPSNDDKTKDYHDFVQVAHRPRVFKSWVQELSDVCRDYFWIFCHGNNTLWKLGEVNDRLVERPTAPGGATGGVEFEAMGYVTVHFRLLNTLSARLAEEDMVKARQLHRDLMLSGLDRILVTMRKASTTYYPTMHLELARYVDLLRRSSNDGKLPYLIGKMLGHPPEELRVHRSAGEWLPRPRLD